MTGKVYIVGAGPGAADLLTLRAASLLRIGEVVLHDDLVSQEILDLVPRAVNIMNVGKRCGRHGNSQAQINALMVEHAHDGKRVVRLKSGDPAVFGRLGEELEALREAEIPFEIVPGITAAAAAAASASITLTDRRAASALVLLTAHRCGNAPLALPAVDPENATFAVYMPGPDAVRSRLSRRARNGAGTHCNTGESPIRDRRACSCCSDRRRSGASKSFHHSRPACGTFLRSLVSILPARAVGRKHNVNVIGKPGENLG